MTPREKAIEKIAEAKHKVAYANSTFLPRWQDLTPKERQYHCKLLECDIDAYLAALEAQGGARKGRCIEMPDGHWTCGTDPMGVVSKLSVLIIKL
jgi:hypothetical protein